MPAIHQSDAFYSVAGRAPAHPRLPPASREDSYWWSSWWSGGGWLWSS
jgi:hypothetical protein